MTEERPIRAWQTLAGICAVVVLGLGVVAGLRLLVQPGDIEPPLGSPGAPSGEDPCSRPLVEPSPTAPVTASALIECPHLYDHQQVTYRGEVVRAVLPRGDRAWVQLNDDPYALSIGPLPEHRTAVGGNSGIPVSIPGAVADDLRHPGDYQHQGDILIVTGVFRRADPADGGGPAIQAATATIEQPGRRIRRTVRTDRMAVAIVLGLAAVLMLVVASRSGARRP